MLRFEIPLKVKICGRATVIRKADKDRMKAAAKRRAEQEKKEEEGAEDGAEERPP